MPAKKIVTPKKKMPSKFVTMGLNSQRLYYLGSHINEEAGLTAAQKALNDRYERYDLVGVYQLVKVVRKLITPVEIEAVADCSDC